MYRLSAPPLVKKAQAESLRTGYLYTEGTNRDFMADAEDLAEGGVKDFLETIKPFLEKEGVIIDRVSQDFEMDGGYSISIEGERFTIYTEPERNAEDVW